MKANDKVDAARVDLLLSEPRFSGTKLVWCALAEEGSPAARFVAALAEQELADRGQRRFALRRGADNLEGPSPGARGWRRLARKRSQSAGSWSARGRKVTLGGGARLGAHRKRLACSLRQDDRFRPEAASRAT